MRRFRSFFCSLWVLLICTVVATFTGQSATAQESRCFSIHVHLNGKLVDGPKVITLKTKQKQRTVALAGGCFKVPSALLAEKAVDISFTVPGNKIYLSAIAGGFFTGPWDIDLADKKFGSEVSLPKHARARDACAVLFHVGEPETQIVQTECRMPVSASRNTM